MEEQHDSSLRKDVREDLKVSAESRKSLKIHHHGVRNCILHVKRQESAMQYSYYFFHWFRYYFF